MNIESTSRAVYYLHVMLKDSTPIIWRDILVPSDITLENLHYVIQTVMGWQNCHTHQFIAEKVLYTDSVENSFDEYDFSSGERGGDGDQNEKNYVLSQLLSKENASIIYEYDLGDSWTHHIELKEILPADTNQPRCLKGENACPPEGCGGIWGYMDILEDMQSNTNFYPDFFDVNTVNNNLKRLFTRRSN